MPRSIDLTARSSHSLDRIRCAFQNDDYWQARLGAFAAGRPILTSLSIDSDGGTSMTMTMRFGADQLPDPMRWLRLPGLDIVQREQWYVAEDGELRGDVTVDALRTPISGHGSVQLITADSGTQLAGTATVAVDVPLIGGAISSFIAGQLATGIIDIVHLTDAWLAANP